MIEVTDLIKTYRSPIKFRNPIKRIILRSYVHHEALKGLSFRIDTNEIVGLVGPNGAGKTSLMKILSGILYPTSGMVRVLNKIPFSKEPQFLKQIAFIMGHKNQLMWELPVSDTLRLNKEIYEIPDRKYNKVCGELIDLLDASDFIDRPVKTLSLGQRMRAELIAALIHSPKVLFLDEPMIGLDIFAQSQIISFLKEYNKHFQATILLSSHHMPDIQKLAKRIIVIQNGSILYDGSLQHMITSDSQLKTLTVVLSKKINVKNLQLPPNASVNYRYPLLTIKVEKKLIEKVLHSLLKQIEYVDMTIENETLDDILARKLNAK